MPSRPDITHIRLNNIETCLTVAANTLKVLADSAHIPFLVAISSTTHSLLNNIQMIKQNKTTCIQLMEQTYELLNAIMIVHIKSLPNRELPPSVLYHIGRFTETLNKIHTFVEVQRTGSKVKRFFRQGEMAILLQQCRAGLQQGLDYFQIKTVNVMTHIAEIQKEAWKTHQEVLDMIEDATLSDTASSGLFWLPQQLNLNFNATVRTKKLSWP
ncbi:hypothetical protein B0H19DRAFT_1265745 [Mycena capillaripes]|nr:hypothetical protein B0H19DRAFT_1265745 [Mycena capillaripes]